MIKINPWISTWMISPQFSGKPSIKTYLMKTKTRGRCHLRILIKTWCSQIIMKVATQPMTIISASAKVWNSTKGPKIGLGIVLRALASILRVFRSKRNFWGILRPEILSNQVLRATRPSCFSNKIKKPWKLSTIWGSKTTRVCASIELWIPKTRAITYSIQEPVLKRGIWVHIWWTIW